MQTCLISLRTFFYNSSEHMASEQGGIKCEGDTGNQHQTDTEKAGQHFKMTWRITDFCYHLQNTKELISPEFQHVLEGHRTRWSMTLYPQGAHSESRGYIDVYLQLAEITPEASVTVCSQIAVLNQEDALVHVIKFPPKQIFNKTCNSYGIPKFINVSTLLAHRSQLLHRENLTLVCEGCFDICPKLGGHASLPIVERGLKSDLLRLLDCEEFSDISLMAEGKEIPTHKAILISRSPYFHNLLCNRKQRKGKTIIDVKGGSVDTVKALLRYMYTDDLPDDPTSLLPLAITFQMETLRDLCETRLCHSITVDNAKELLSLANQHKVPKLQETATSYIQLHAVDAPTSTTAEDDTGARVHKIEDYDSHASLRPRVRSARGRTKRP